MHDVHDVTSLQKWLEDYGGQLEVLKLQATGDSGLPTALPCPQLQHLYLHADFRCLRPTAVDDRVWEGISAATELKTLSLDYLQTAQTAEAVMAVLAALPDLQHLSWCLVECSGVTRLPAVPSLQLLTKLTGLELQFVSAGLGAAECFDQAAAPQHGWCHLPVGCS